MVLINFLIHNEHSHFIPDWASIYFIVIFALLAWLRVSAGSHMLATLQAGFNNQTASRLYREKANNIMHPSFRYNLVFYIVLGVLILHIQKNYFNSLPYTDPLLAVLNIVSVFLFFNIKFFLYRTAGFLYKCQNETDEFLFYSRTMNHVLGFLLLPLSVLLFFTEGIVAKTTLVLTLLTFLIASVINVFRGFGIKSEKDFPKYYLILYLCTLEILPFLVLWRVFR